MDPLELPDCTHDWSVTVAATAQPAALEAQLPGLLATAEGKGITSVTLAACGELPVLERTAFIMLGLRSMEQQPLADGVALVRFTDAPA